MENLNTKKFYDSIDEYKKFNKLLPKGFAQTSYKQFKKNYRSNCGLSSDIYYKMLIQNRINLELCKKIKNGNIELEIYLIDKYMPIVDYIFNKLKLNESGINKEDVIIKSLETYDGIKLFSIHILNALNKHYINKNERVLVKTKQF